MRNLPTLVANPRGLDFETIKAHCPAIFAAEKHESRSKSYTYFSTEKLLHRLLQEDFIPTYAQQSTSRIEGKSDYTKHLVRFRHRSALGYNSPDTHEIGLWNSHDGTSAYNLQSWIYRQVCTNGLMRWENEGSWLKVNHKGDIETRIVESTLELLGTAEEVMNDVAVMKQVELSRPEQKLLAEYVMKARFDLDDEDQDGNSPKKEVIYRPDDFLRVRRASDAGRDGLVLPDLYTTMNVVQENTMKGGISRYDSQAQKRKTTRAIHGIDQNIKINKLIWSFSQELRKIHGM